MNDDTINVAVHINEFEKTLNATDRLLEAIIQDENCLYDSEFIAYLYTIRHEHKKTLSILENLCESSQDLLEGIDYCDEELDINSNENKYFEKKRSHSMHCLHESWHEEETVQLTKEEWVSSIINETGDRRQTKSRNSIGTKNIRMKSNYSKKFVGELEEAKQITELEKQEEVKKLRSRAGVVPKTTYEPIYTRILEEQEKAKEKRREKALKTVELAREPFTTRRKSLPSCHLRRCISAEEGDWRKSMKMQTGGVPMSMYVLPAKHEFLARMRSKQRAERSAHLLRTSRSPQGLKEHSIRSKVQHYVRHNRLCSGSKTQSKPSIPIASKVPNFKKIHERMSEKLENARATRSTVTVPFRFQSDHGIRSHQCTKKETPKPIIHYNGNSLKQTTTYQNIRFNNASLLRNDAIRLRMKRIENEKNGSLAFWQKMNDDNRLAKMRLRQKLSDQFRSCNNLEYMIQDKRREQLSRAEEYQNELEEMNRRIMNRALILEQQEMLIEKQRFERNYQKSIARLKNGQIKVFTKGFKKQRCDSKRSESLDSRNPSDNRFLKIQMNENDNESSEKSSSGSDSDEDEDDKGLQPPSASSYEDKLSKISERTENSSTTSRKSE